MTEEKFEELVNEGIKEIPEIFLEKLSNIDICIEDKPSSSQLAKVKIKKGFSLLGLYEGVPQTNRGDYANVLPDKITIFKNSIEKNARSEEDIKETVKETVWHEIAHHFGLNEEEVRRAERKRVRIRTKKR